VVQTDSVFDWAIDGRGYFVLNDPDTGRTVYSRTGSFTVDGNGMVATATRPSWRLSPLVILNPDRLGQTRLTPDGALLVPASGTQADLLPSAIVAGPIGLCSDCEAIPQGWQVLGRVTLAVFAKPEGLSKRPDGLLEVSDSDAVGERRIVTPAARAASGSDSGPWDQPGRLLQGYLETSTASNLPKFPIPIPLGLGRP
jgi:flagellar basal body rod protein FlgG